MYKRQRSWPAAAGLHRLEQLSYLVATDQVEYLVKAFPALVAHSIRPPQPSTPATSIGAMSRTKRSFAVTKISADGTRDTRAGQVAVEEPLEIRAGGVSVATLMRTPGHDIELAHGLLLARGMITRGEDVVTARYCEGAIGGENTYNLLDIDLARPAPPRFIDPIPGDSCGISAEQRVRELAANLDVRDTFMAVSYTHLTLPTNREV